MGPWEALAHLPALVAREEIEAPFAALYRPLNNAYLDAWYRTQREAKGTRLFSRRDGFHKTADFLREGGVLGVLADQKTGRKAGVVVPFFGRRAKTNPLPGLLQRRAGVPMLALSLRTLSPGRWCLGLHPVDLPSGLPGERSREADASICNAALERVLAKSPLDGFWLHGRFSGKLP
jgi:KDO2-lipid IV(A) lauroyltransferase